MESLEILLACIEIQAVAQDVGGRLNEEQLRDRLATVREIAGEAIAKAGRH